jgi:hypothetical protein
MYKFLLVKKDIILIDKRWNSDIIDVRRGKGNTEWYPVAGKARDRL